MNSLCIRDAISEGAGTSSKRLVAVPPVLLSMPLTVVVLARTFIPNVEQYLDSMVYFAMADPFHVCGTAPAPVVSRQFHCGGLPNPRGRKKPTACGVFPCLSANRAGQRLGSYWLTL